MLELFTFYLKKISHFLHENCVSFSELLIKDEATQSAFGSLVCAAPNRYPLFEHFFAATGLYHLLVVSGSHLTFLTLALELSSTRSWIPKAIQKQALFFYCLITDLQAPLLRAFFQWFLQDHWSSRNSLLFSGILCLLFFPSWIHSWSLYLSWLASAALGLRPWPLAWTQLMMSWPLRPFSMLSFLNNLWLAPLLSLSLFFSAWVALVSTNVSQSLISGHQFLMNWFLSHWPVAESSDLIRRSPELLDWLLLAALVCLLRLFHGSSKRKQP
ncbi:MAG: ComEC/Rec2 family competence protein [Proteobacteria bacterium]|jgi:predicted membrane metal-binding protein|nr:ComEC/Rec2 family competence protein [Pseudomonadota bacterium]